MKAPPQVIIHLPHCSTLIPEEVRSGLLLSDSELETELLRITDWYVDELFDWVGAEKMINRFSRLVVDPERFRDDDREAMARVGRGAVYTHTSYGQQLRIPTPEEREELLQRFYDPYHYFLELKVRSILKHHNRCLIVDAHSFTNRPLPCEDSSPGRPDICIGTDDYHTPATLAKFAWDYFLANGFTVAFNSPFAGTMVPGTYYRRDRRVVSIMIEVNRSRYMDESTGEKTPSFDLVKDRLEGLIKVLTSIYR
ncbi:MAG: N-formylglutamate amidohydrolase [Firmicutes bacterium]|nr:N-formylglutamate amidohydrolase [Bacillota bacterium]